MTTQVLKDNRNEIISRINKIADNTKMVEIMKAMVNLVEGGMNESNDPIDLVDEVVEMLGYQKRISVNEIEEMRLKAIRNQRPSSLR